MSGPRASRTPSPAAAAPGAAYLASGTNLLDLMKGGIARPDRLVDVTRLPGLDRIERTADGGLRIGALVRNADLAHDPEFARSLSGGGRGAVVRCVRAASQCGDGRRQSAATNAVRIFLRRPPAPATSANRAPVATPRDGRESTARHTRLERGLHRHQPVGFLRATGRARRRRRNRRPRRPARGCARGAALPARRYAGAGKPARARRPSRRAAAARPRPARSRRMPAISRSASAPPTLSPSSSAAACLRIEAGRIRDARLALGGVAAKPWRAHPAEKILVGASADAATYRRAAEAALADAKPSGDNLFKIELAKRIIVRTLTLSAAGTPARISAFSPLPPSHPYPECPHDA